MKTKIYLFSIILFLNYTVNAQIKVRPDAKVQIAYNGYSQFLIDAYSSGGYENGQWAFEHWDGGLNICKNWPSPNSGNYHLFIQDNNGYVGIGRKPSYKLDVNGDIATYGTLRISSDARLKTNITGLTNCKDKLHKLNGKSYKKKYPEIKYNFSDITDSIKYKTILAMNNRENNSSSENQFGFIGQELGEVFPELTSKDSSGYITVDYIGLIPVIVEALKEQDSIISAQNTEIESLKKLIKKGNVKSAEVQIDIKSNDGIASLDQNAPNPFNQSSVIGYFLPESVRVASFYIYDMNGTQIKSMTVHAMGKGNITINGSELRPGMYLYTLIADGKEVDTKRMILTE